MIIHLYKYAFTIVKLEGLAIYIHGHQDIETKLEEGSVFFIQCLIDEVLEHKIDSLRVNCLKRQQLS